MVLNDEFSMPTWRSPDAVAARPSRLRLGKTASLMKYAGRVFSRPRSSRRCALRKVMQISDGELYQALPVRALFSGAWTAAIPHIAVKVDSTPVPDGPHEAAKSRSHRPPRCTAPMGNEMVEFSARPGIARQVLVPVANVYTIYARETGRDDLRVELAEPAATEAGTSPWHNFPARLPIPAIPTGPSRPARPAGPQCAASSSGAYNCKRSLCCGALLTALRVGA